MPRCAALGCKSGYDINPERFNFFGVPKNDAEAKLWQQSSRRFDIKLESRVFCEKHFKEEDIIRTKRILDTNGKLIQEVMYDLLLLSKLNLKIMLR